MHIAVIVIASSALNQNVNRRAHTLRIKVYHTINIYIYLHQTNNINALHAPKLTIICSGRSRINWLPSQKNREEKTNEIQIRKKNRNGITNLTANTINLPSCFFYAYFLLLWSDMLFFCCHTQIYIYIWYNISFRHIIHHQNHKAVIINPLSCHFIYIYFSYIYIKIYRNNKHISECNIRMKDWTARTLAFHASSQCIFDSKVWYFEQRHAFKSKKQQSGKKMSSDYSNKTSETEQEWHEMHVIYIYRIKNIYILNMICPYRLL